MGETTKRPDRLVDQIVATSTARSRKQIKDWRTALTQAESAENPSRILLYNLYDELELDGHLSSEVQKRIFAVQGAHFSLVDQDGEVDFQATALLRKQWFYNTIDLAMQAVFYGHSVIQIGDLVDGEIKDVELVKRKHIIPEKGLFTIRQGDEKGIYYRTDPTVEPFILEIGDKKNLGLYNKCVPHVLFSRFAQSAFSEFTELFVMPARFGKTNTKDEDSFNKMYDMLRDMSTAAYAVIDIEEEIQFVETAKSSGEAFINLIKICEAIISKIVNGAVIGDDSSGGSRSKEEVGERIGSLISSADKQAFQGIANTVILPKLINLGYPFEGLSFKFEKSTDIKALWEMVKGMLEHYDIEPEYIENTFNIPVTAKKKETSNNNLNAGSFFD